MAALTAASWDRLARRLLVDRAGGLVHSVFDRALNLRLAGDELVSVVGPDAGNGPATVVLCESPVPGFTSRGLAPGQSWSITRQRLVLSCAPLEVDLSVARLWPTNDAVIARAISADEVLFRLRRAEQVAAATAPVGGLAALLPHTESLAAASVRDVAPADSASDQQIGQTLWSSDAAAAPIPPPADPIVRRALAATAELVHGWRARDRERVKAAATRLSGLGPGLTPSGDDLLAGFLFGIDRASGHSEPELTEDIVAATRGRTNDVAAARVRHAANGLIEERMQDVVAALLTGAGTDLEPVVRRTVAWGQTSGADTLVGLFLGLRLGR